LRRATADDAETIAELVRELAIYEREPQAAKATAEDFRRLGFGPEPLFEALIAETAAPKQAAGFALYFFTFSTWTGKPSLYLEDLFVRESHRKRGIGKALFLEVAKIAVERDCARYQWQVLDWNAPSIAFYEGLGARATNEWVPFRLEGEALKKAARLR
jgi:GNAT superfamily N-acetyltransferase